MQKGLHRRSPILETLAGQYAESTLGKTGLAARPFSHNFVQLLEKAKCGKGEALTIAEQDLKEANGSALVLIINRRSHDIERVTVPPACEEALFRMIGRTSPTAERAAWSSLLREAATWPVPETRREAWQRFCEERAAQMDLGVGLRPFRRRHRNRARFQLEVTARLLGWTNPQPALLRIVSAQLARSSKFLENARQTIVTLLGGATNQAVRSFADLGITDNPQSVIFHGPVRISLDGTVTDYSGHEGRSSLGEEDIARADSIRCAAPRCITVENLTTFHALCRLRSGDLFVHTSYPSRATVAFLNRLPASLARYHFGDTDPWGFDVLRSLRRAVFPITILPLHMAFRPAESPEPMTERDQKKLARLLADPSLLDVRSELERMHLAGTKGDFEQERLAVSGTFPYR